MRLDAGDLGRIDALIWPAPTPSVMPPPQKTMAFDLTNLATRSANSRSSICCAVGCFFVTTLRPVGLGGEVVRRLHQQATADALQFQLVRSRPSGTTSTRRFCFEASAALASALKDGAISTSTKCLRSFMAFTTSRPTSPLKAMMPPKAEVESVLKAFVSAEQVGVDGDAAGLACLMMTQAGASKALTHSHAASASAMLFVGQFLALQLRVGGDAARQRLGVAVEGSGLVRILAVAQDLGAVEGELQLGGKIDGVGAAVGRLGFGAFIEAGQPVGDHAVVAGGVREGLLRQAEAGGELQAAVVLLHLRRAAARSRSGR